MHLLNVARSLLFRRGIDLKMWTECILTATYLINRLPSSVLSEKSPYELIYNEKPTLTHLRVFGCLCFATMVNNSDKISSYSEKCVMMRYSKVKNDIYYIILIHINSSFQGIFILLNMFILLKM